MGAILTLAKRVTTLAKDTKGYHEEALDGGTVVLLPGDPVLTERLSSRLGIPVGDRPSADLVVIPLGMTDDARVASRETAARARQNRRTLIVVVAPDHLRGRREAEILADPDVTIGDLVFAHDFESDASVVRITDGIIRALGPRMVPAARRYPALRPAVRRQVVVSAARESAVAGAINWFPGAAAAQLAMVVRSGSVEGRGLSAARVPEVAVATGTGLVISAVARGASYVVPVPRWITRGVVAWASTVALAVAQDRISRTTGGDSLDSKSAVTAFVRARLRRKGKN